MSIHVKFWGTRGSIPTPASWTRVYGGNTSCVEVRFDDTIFVCDAGSGIRELGMDLLTRKPLPTELHLLITHTHWDHIQGFPFFAPAYWKEMKIRVYGNGVNDDSHYRLLSGQMSSPYFPVSFRDLGAQIVCDHLESTGKEVNGVRVRSIPLNHPGGCCGYLFEKNGRKIVYATDNELDMPASAKSSGATSADSLRSAPPALVEAVMGADLLIADAQYDDAQYAAKKGWGHSSCFSVTDLAVQAGVRNLALFHHDPESTDRDIDTKVLACTHRATRLGGTPVIFAARESVELKF
jgi:phosphoribosyl 1,2-cyclic phosphodiesterase